MKNIIEEYKERKETEEAAKNIRFESINEILDKTKKCVKISMCDINYIKVPKEVKEDMKQCKNAVTELQNKLPKIREVFMKDKKYRNGFIRKSVINALKSSKYQKLLKFFIAEVRKNKTINAQSLSNYIDYHDLSVDPNQISRTLKAIEEYLLVLESALNNNNILGIPRLLLYLNILINRIRKLYELYGIYLKDINKLEEYNSISKIFENINYVIKHCMLQCLEFNDWLNEERLKNEK